MEDGKCHKVYSDGSYIKEIDKAGYCIVILKDGEKKEITGSNKTDKHIQNYEIYALAKAVEVMKEEKIEKASLLSDSLTIIRQVNKKLKGKDLNTNQQPFEDLYHTVVSFLKEYPEVILTHIKSKENIADNGSRVSAYKEMYQSVLEKKQKIQENNFFFSQKFMLVDNCLSDTAASVFIRRKKRSFFNYFIKEYVGINIEKYEKNNKHYHKVFFYNKNELTHKVHYSLLFEKKTDFEVISEVLKNQYTRKYQQVLFTLNSENKVLDLLYLKKSLNDCNENETKYLNEILNNSQEYEKICFVDGIKPDFCLRTGEKRIKIKKRVKEKELKQVVLN